MRVIVVGTLFSEQMELNVFLKISVHRHVVHFENLQKSR